MTEKRMTVDLLDEMMREYHDKTFGTKQSREFSMDEYQRKAKETAIYPVEYKTIYPVMGMAGEVGEVANRVQKNMRDGTPADRDALIKEYGDILWFLSAACSDLGVTLSEVAQKNIVKLNSRKERGTLGGFGDER